MSFYKNLKKKPVFPWKSKSSQPSLNLFTVSQVFTLYRSDERIFPVKFLLACSLFELKANESLDIFYSLLNAQKTKIFALRKKNGTARVPLHQPKESSQSDFTVWKNVEVETHELFGAFPGKDDCCAKYIMLAHEICRVHTRLMDYRNAYKVMLQCARLFPKSPFVLSKAGRFCLEVGRRTEAQKFFEQVSSLLDEHNRHSQS